MGITVEELVQRLGFEVDQASLKRSQAQVQTAASGMASTLMKIAGAVTAAFSVYQLGSAAVGAASEMEGLNAEFETMLGSAAKAQALIGDIRQMGKFTPFETMDLARNAKMLMGFGVATEKVLPYMRMLGDVAGSNRERFNQMTLAFSQISAAGRLQGQDLMQLINAGFNPLQIIAEKTGRSMAELKDEMSDGKISFEMVADAFKAVTSEGGRFYKNMERQSTTLVGLWSTFKDVINETFIDVGGIVLPTLKELVKFATKIMEGPIVTLATTLAGVVLPLFNDLAARMMVMWERLQAPGAVLYELLRVMAVRVLEVMGGVWDTVKSVLSIVRPLVAVLGGALFYAWDAVLTVVGALWLRIQDVVAVLAGPLTRLVQNIAAAFGGLGSSGSVVLDILLFIVDAVGWLATGLAYVVAEFANIVSAVMELIGPTETLSLLLGMVGGAKLALGIGAVTAAITAMGAAIIGVGTGFMAWAAANPILLATAAALASIGFAVARIKGMIDEFNERTKVMDSMEKQRQIGEQRLQRAQARNRLAEIERQGGARTDAERQEVQTLQRRIAVADRALRNLGYESAEAGADASNDGLLGGLANMLRDVTGVDITRAMKEDAERRSKVTNVKQTNNITVNAPVDDTGRTKMTPDNLAKATRSVFAIELQKVLVGVS